MADLIMDRGTRLCSFLFVFKKAALCLVDFVSFDLSPVLNVSE